MTWNIVSYVEDSNTMLSFPRYTTLLYLFWTIETHIEWTDIKLHLSFFSLSFFIYNRTFCSKWTWITCIKHANTRTLIWWKHLQKQLTCTTKTHNLFTIVISFGNNKSTNSNYYLSFKCLRFLFILWACYSADDFTASNSRFLLVSDAQEHS